MAGTVYISLCRQSMKCAAELWNILECNCLWCELSPPLIIFISYLSLPILSLSVTFPPPPLEKLSYKLCGLKGMGKKFLWEPRLYYPSEDKFLKSKEKKTGNEISESNIILGQLTDRDWLQFIVILFSIHLAVLGPWTNLCKILSVEFNLLVVVVTEFGGHKGSEYHVDLSTS